MRDHSTHHQLDQLLARLIDGDATERDIAKLDEILDGDSDAQRRYVHYFDLHAELVKKSQTSTLSNSAESDRRELSTLRWILGLVATGLAAALLTAVALRFGENLGEVDDPIIVRNEEITNAEDLGPTDDGVAVLTHAADALWLNSLTLKSGAILSPGEFKLGRGVIQVEFYYGAQLLVEGPADLEIVSVDRVICRQGKLRARVPSHAAGFSVLTPSFELVDLGDGVRVGRHQRWTVRRSRLGRRSRAVPARRKTGSQQEAGALWRRRGCVVTEWDESTDGFGS